MTVGGSTRLDARCKVNLGLAVLARRGDLLLAHYLLGHNIGGNTTDICPVGALTTTDFRFQARPWELTPVASVCTHCPVGCNTTMSTRREARSGGRAVIKRIMPRQNEMVNEIWICDKGRFVHHYADAPDRLQQPLVRRNGELAPATWDEALELVAQKLQENKEAVAGLSGDRLSNEDMFLFQRLLRDGLGSANIDQAQARIGGADVVAQVGLSKDSNLLGLGKGDAILIVASDLHQEAPVWWLRVKQAADRGAKIIVANARPTKLDRFATVPVRYRYGEAVSVLNGFAGSALELFQGAALAHDDLMDGSLTRRGLPAVHRRLEPEACTVLTAPRFSAPRARARSMRKWRVTRA